MNKISTIFSLSFLLLVTGVLCAQTRVTGHVFAEVVESVSASSQSQTNFSIQRSQTDAINIGQIQIKSGASSSCSLMLGKANLKNSNNQTVTMQTSAQYSPGTLENAINGNQSIGLQCKANENMLTNNTTAYLGEINIVLAYN